MSDDAPGRIWIPDAAAREGFQAAGIAPDALDHLLATVDAQDAEIARLRLENADLQRDKDAAETRATAFQNAYTRRLEVDERVRKRLDEPPPALPKRPSRPRGNPRATVTQGEILQTLVEADGSTMLTPQGHLNFDGTPMQTRTRMAMERAGWVTVEYDDQGDPATVTITEAGRAVAARAEAAGERRRAKRLGAFLARRAAAQEHGDDNGVRG